MQKVAGVFCLFELRECQDIEILIREGNHAEMAGVFYLFELQ